MGSTSNTPAFVPVVNTFAATDAGVAAAITEKQSKISESLDSSVDLPEGGTVPGGTIDKEVDAEEGNGERADFDDERDEEGEEDSAQGTDDGEGPGDEEVDAATAPSEEDVAVNEAMAEALDDQDEDDVDSEGGEA